VAREVPKSGEILRPDSRAGLDFDCYDAAVRGLHDGVDL
jgi:hypothetical protein